MDVRTQRTKQDERRRLVMQVRSSVLFRAADEFRWQDLGAKLGLTRGSLATLFTDERALLDSVNDTLVAETQDRLRSAAQSLRASTFGSVDDAARAVTHAVVLACPLDRSGLLFRAERRARALRGPHLDDAVNRAEHLFLATLQTEIVALLAVIGREAFPSALVMARALLNSYERAFEAWLIRGRSETDFGGSHFASHELPALVLALSRPTGD